MEGREERGRLIRVFDVDGFVIVAISGRRLLIDWEIESHCD